MRVRRRLLGVSFDSVDSCTLLPALIEMKSFYELASCIFRDRSLRLTFTTSSLLHSLQDYLQVVKHDEGVLAEYSNRLATVVQEKEKQARR